MQSNVKNEYIENGYGNVNVMNYEVLIGAMLGLNVGIGKC